MAEPSVNMRASRVLRKLRAGETAIAFKSNLADARVAEIAGIAGFDCFWADMEHVATDWSTIERQVWASKVYDMDVMVRVARGSYSDHIKPLELDAAGIMVPHIMSLADAQRVVQMTRFHPTGRRPVDGGNADGRYTNLDFVQYLSEANAQRFLCVQIEDPEPLAELEEIVALPGIDMIFFGPADFSQGLGAPGRFDHPDLLATRARIAEACLRQGKFAGTVGSLVDMDGLLAMGYRFLAIGADVVGLSEYCRSITSAARRQKVMN